MIEKKYFVTILATSAILLCSVRTYASGKDSNSVSEVNSSPKAEAAENMTINAGGKSIVIPAPCAELREVGYDKRELLEVVVPASNRLLSAFAKAEEANMIGSGNPLTQYALLEIFRQAEFMDCNSSDFASVVGEMNQSTFGKELSSTTDEINAEMSKRCKDIGSEEIQIGQPEIIGTQFSIPDATSIVMMIAVNQNSQSIKMLCSCCVLRVKDRLLYAYVYTQYKDESSLKWLNAASEKWAKGILNANKGK